MASISEAQASLGSDFTVGGIDRVAKLEFTEVEALMTSAALKFIKLAKKRLTQRGKIDTGNLSDLIVGDLTNKGGTYEITVGYLKSNPASKYFDYNDLGVRGVGGFKGKLPRGFKQPTNSPYSFRDPIDKITLSKGFIDSIIKWYLRHKQYIRNDDQRKNLSALQRKRKTLASIVPESEKIRGLAIATAKNIKRKGISRTGFITDNVEEAFGKDFQIKLSKALGQDFVLNIKKAII
jgi:hypothetical protein